METKAYFERVRRGDADGLRRLLREEPGLVASRTVPDYAPERQIDCTGLHLAVYADHLDVARALLDAGIDVEARTKEGRTALHDAIEFGRSTVRELLIERGATVDVCAAAILGKLDRLRELLDADPALANDRSTQLSPLGWAAYGNRVDSARELLDRGARMDDFELHCAASVGHVEVGRFLMERGADPNAIDPDTGAAALHVAAAMKYTHDSSAFVRMLVEHGADVRRRTADGRTALDVAEHCAREQRGSGKRFDAVAAVLRKAEAARP